MSGFSPITWVNGSTPANASNMQRYDDWIQQLEGDANAITISGTTAGSATIYPILQGTVKAFLAQLNGYKNASATEQTITLPTAFTFGALVVSGNIQQLDFYNSGTIVNTKMSDVDGLSSSGGSSSVYTAIHPLDFGQFSNAFSAVGFGFSQSATYNGLVFVLGI